MFDIPDAKRVRRADLSHSRSASPSPSIPDPSLEEAFQAQLAALYGPLPTAFVPTPDPDQRNEEHDAEDQNDNEFEFRLFSSTSASAANKDATVQKILLDDDESKEEAGEGRFLRPRPRSYYIYNGTSEERKREFAFAALGGEQILELARKRALGLEVPWRVKVLRSTSKLKLDPATARIEIIDDEAVRAGKKTKPGKKRRILLREMRRKREAADEGRKKREEEKEAAEREKRTRRNREKKVKRKMKEKAKKMAGGAIGATDGEAGVVNDIGSGSEGD